MKAANLRTITVEEARCLLKRLKGVLEDPFASDLKNLRTNQLAMRFVAVFFTLASVAYPILSWGEPIWSILAGTAFYSGVGIFAICRLNKLRKMRHLLEVRGVQNVSELEVEGNGAGGF